MDWFHSVVACKVENSKLVTPLAWESDNADNSSNATKRPFLLNHAIGNYPAISFNGFDDAYIIDTSLDTKNFTVSYYANASRTAGIKIKANASRKKGGDNNIFLWIGLLVAMMGVVLHLKSTKKDQK